MNPQSHNSTEKIEKTTQSSPLLQAQRRGTVRSILLVLTVTLATIVNDANAGAFAMALPTIQRELGLQQGQLQWIVSGYPLTSGCFLLVCGRLADLYGRKRTFLIGSFVLVSVTLGCAFSKDAITLNILRAIQGIGAAAQIPASIGILADAFPPSRARNFAFATFSAGAAIGAVFGTVVSGVLTEFTKPTWRSSCYLLTGMSMVCLLGGLISIDEDKPSEDKDKRVDWLGAFLVTAGLVQIIFVLSQGQVAENKWKTPYIIFALISGVFCISAFLYWQYFLENAHSSSNFSQHSFPPPLFKLSLWKRANGQLAAMMAIAFFNWSAFLAWIFWVQLYYQNYKLVTPLETAIYLLPMFFSGILCNMFVGFGISRIPLGWIITIGTLGTTMACLLFAVISPKTTYWAYAFPAIFLSSMGADLVSSAGGLFIVKVALADEQSVVGGLFMTMMQIGTAVGVVVSTVVVDAVAFGDGGNSMMIYRVGQWTAFGFGVIASVIGIVAFRNVVM